ncbi:mitosis inhibitor protein kinase swe1 [Conglomerata obtusa]
MKKKPFFLKSEKNESVTLTPKTPMKSQPLRHHRIINKTVRDSSSAEYVPYFNSSKCIVYDGDAEEDIPDRLGRLYSVIEKVGEGDYCEVFVVRKKEVGRGYNLEKRTNNGISIGEDKNKIFKVDFRQNTIDAGNKREIGVCEDKNVTSNQLMKARNQNVSFKQPMKNYSMYSDYSTNFKDQNANINKPIIIKNQNETLNQPMEIDDDIFGENLNENTNFLGENELKRNQNDKITNLHKNLQKNDKEKSFNSLSKQNKNKNNGSKIECVENLNEQNNVDKSDVLMRTNTKIIKNINEEHDQALQENFSNISVHENSLIIKNSNEFFHQKYSKDINNDQENNVRENLVNNSKGFIKKMANEKLEKNMLNTPNFELKRNHEKTLFNYKKEKLYCLSDPTLSCIKKNKRPFKGEIDRKCKLKEINIMKNIKNYPFITEILSAWEENNYLYIEEEFCSFGTLKELIHKIYHLEKSKFSDDLINKLMFEISSGLEKLHGLLIVHSDLRPENIYLKPNKLIKCEEKCDCKIENNFMFKIGDFNISRFENEEIQEDGDKRYMPPEILLNKGYVSGDIYSLGLIYLELLSGIVLPNTGDEWLKLRKNHFGSLRLTKIQKSEKSLILKMIDKDYAKRITAGELVKIFGKRIKSS